MWGDDEHGNWTVLVAEHDLWTRHVMAAQLAKAGFKVLQASNGTAALRVVARHACDMVLLGEGLPELPSQELLRQIKSERGTASVPVMLAGGSWTLEEHLLADATREHLGLESTLFLETIESLCRLAHAPESSPGSEHLVLRYGSESELIDGATSFLLAGKEREELPVFVAAGPHRAALEASVGAALPDQATWQEAYFSIDAMEMLSSVVGRDGLDEKRFEQACGSLVHRAAAQGQAVRIYGELAPLLARNGNVADAIRLEQLCSHLSGEFGFSLLCGYPRGGKTPARALEDMIEAEHSWL